MRDVDLPEGLESIGKFAFAGCPSLRHITIPSTVKEITWDIFNDSDGDNELDSTNLRSVRFCEEIEEFVSGESIRVWWDNGTSERSFQTYNFLIQYKAPSRLILLSKNQWQANIHEMLSSIPTVDFDALGDHFTAVDALLTVYEITDAMSLLELALWKSKIRAQHGPNMGNLSGTERSQCRDNCGACVIIPRVLPFLKNIS